MRKFIDIVAEDVAQEGIIKSTWTQFQDRDGIYLTHPGSNSIYAGFADQTEAEVLAKQLGAPWRVLRWGRYKEMTDEEAMRDYDIRRQRQMLGFKVDPILEAQDILGPEEDDEYEEPVDLDYERATRVEKHIRDVCRKQFGWELENGHAVMYDTDHNEITLTLKDEEVTLAHLEALKPLGTDMAISASSGNYTLTVTIKTEPGLDVPH